MITRNGIEIMSKYLTGHTNSYASHIAIGCGIKPYYTKYGVLNSYADPATDSGLLTGKLGYSGTVSTISGSGTVASPWTATLTLDSNQNTSSINVGDVIVHWLSKNGTGKLSQSKYTNISGTVTTVNSTTATVSVPSTDGLVTNMSLTKTSGAGAFGSTPLISAINPSTNTITVTTVTASTNGAIVFSASGIVSDRMGGVSNQLKSVTVFAKTSNTITIKAVGGNTPVAGTVEEVYLAPTGYNLTITSVTGTGPWTVVADITNNDSTQIAVGDYITQYLYATGSSARLWEGAAGLPKITAIQDAEITYTVSGGTIPVIGDVTKVVIGKTFTTNSNTGSAIYSTGTGISTCYAHLNVGISGVVQSINYLDPQDSITLDAAGSVASIAKVVSFASKQSMIVETQELNALMLVQDDNDNNAVNPYITIEPINKDKNYFTNNRLKFEMLRVPVQSFSYITNSNEIRLSRVDIVSGSNVITFTTATSHKLKIGDRFTISGIVTTGGPSTTDPNIDSETDYYYVDSVTSATVITAIMSKTAASTYAYTSAANNITTSSLMSVYSSQISLTAELPSASRYEITELGLYSIGTDILDGGSPSRNIINFSQNENWSFYNQAEVGFSAVPYILDIGDASNNVKSSTPKAFFCNSEDPFFTSGVFTDRTERFERPRFGSDAIIVSGDLSTFDSSLVPTTTSNYIEADITADLSQNSLEDELLLAVSIINKNYQVSTSPKAYSIVLQFFNARGDSSVLVKFLEVDSYYALSGNRYTVLSKKLKDIVIEPGFSWKDVSSVRVYANVSGGAVETTSPLSDFSIILDGLRFENNSNVNPLYGLVAYSPITSDSIIKKSNTSNLIEFRLDVGVGI